MIRFTDVFSTNIGALDFWLKTVYPSNLSHVAANFVGGCAGQVVGYSVAPLLE